MKKDLVIFVMKMEEMTIALQPYCFRYGGRVVEDGGTRAIEKRKLFLCLADEILLVVKLVK